MVRQTNPRKNHQQFKKREEDEHSLKPKRKETKVKYRHRNHWLEDEEDYNFEQDLFGESNEDFNFDDELDTDFLAALDEEYKDEFDFEAENDIDDYDSEDNY